MVVSISANVSSPVRNQRNPRESDNGITRSVLGRRTNCNWQGRGAPNEPGSVAASPAHARGLARLRRAPEFGHFAGEPVLEFGRFVGNFVGNYLFFHTSSRARPPSAVHGAARMYSAILPRNSLASIGLAI